MEQCRVFYSWQSDLPNKCNRGLILDALEIVVKTFKTTTSVDVEPVIDRDTSGVSGSPDIASTIFEKIEKCDVFVCDVSIINSDYSKRKTPNPNVLVELGYAAKSLGWERIILVMNTAFGLPEHLPFDLRMRRVLQFNNTPNEDGRANSRNNLANQLKSALSLIIVSNPLKPTTYETQSIEHDKKIFEQATKVMTEYQFGSFLQYLRSDNSFNNRLFDPVQELEYYYREIGNKYLILDLFHKTETFLTLLGDLFNFLATHFFVWPESITRDNVKFYLYPDLNIERGGTGDFEDMERYNEYQQQLLVLCNEVENAYVEYRLTVKRNLFI